MIFLVAAFVAAVIVVALTAYPAAFAGRERATCALAVVIAVIGATAYFVGVTYRLAVVTVGIGAAACAYLWPVGRRARGAFWLVSRVIPSAAPAFGQCCRHDRASR